MFHVPAHKNVDHPAGQSAVRDPSRFAEKSGYQRPDGRITKAAAPRYILWECDNGTYDVVDTTADEGDAVVFQNLPAPVARAFVAHDRLVAALREIARDALTAAARCGTAL